MPPSGGSCARLHTDQLDALAIAAKVARIERQASLVAPFCFVARTTRQTAGFVVDLRGQTHRIREQSGEAWHAARALERGPRAACASASIFDELKFEGMASIAWTTLPYEGDLDGTPVRLVAPGDMRDFDQVAEMIEGEAPTPGQLDAARLQRFYMRSLCRARYASLSSLAVEWDFIELTALNERAARQVRPLTTIGMPVACAAESRVRQRPQRPPQVMLNLRPSSDVDRVGPVIACFAAEDVLTGRYTCARPAWRF